MADSLIHIDPDADVSEPQALPDDVLAIGETEIIDFEPLCATCGWGAGFQDNTCIAFPSGIPQEILEGSFDHHAPWPGGEEVPVQYVRRFL